MREIKAFVGHSFNEYDQSVVRVFTEFLNTIRETGIPFTWKSAIKAEPKEVWEKVVPLFEGCNLFIGICTHKDFAISRGLLSHSIGMAYAKASSFQRKPSDWILQETGLARGLKMSIILLVEEGVQAPSGLLGDHEYIPFYRTNPESSLAKLLEMIGTLSKENEVPLLEDLAKSEQKTNKAAADDRSEKIENREEADDEDKVKGKLTKAIFEKDEISEQRAADEYLKLKGEDAEYHVVLIKAARLYLHAYWNNKDNFSDLQELAQANPDHDAIPDYMAHLLSFSKEHLAAATLFQRAADLTEGTSLKLDRLGQAMTEFSKIKNGNWAKVAAQINFDELTPHQKSRYLQTLSTVYKNLEEPSNQFAFGELSLSLDPTNHEFRFELALDYSNNSINDLALHHYKVLSELNPSANTWNNYGVVLHALGLKINSVNAYRESEKFNETIAMGNLAQKFINEGFAAEAEAIIEKAQKVEDYDRSILGKAGALSDQKKEEEEKIEHSVERAKPQRQFLCDYSSGWLDNQPLDFQATFKGKDFSINLAIEGGKLKAIAEFVMEKSGVTYKSGLQKQKINTKYLFVGTLNGRSCEFQKTTFEDDIEKSIDKGWLTIEKDLLTLRIAEDKLIVSSMPKVFNKV